MSGFDGRASRFDTPIATGEMLTSPAKHGELIRPGLGVSLSEQARGWTREQVELGKRP